MAALQTDPQYKLRMPDGLRDRLRAAAEANHRSMNAEIVARLEGSFDAPSADLLGELEDHLSSPDASVAKMFTLLMRQADAYNDRTKAIAEAIRERIAETERQVRAEQEATQPKNSQAAPRKAG